MKMLKCTMLIVSVSSLSVRAQFEDEAKISNVEIEILNKMEFSRKHNDYTVLAEAIELSERHFSLTKENDQFYKKYEKTIESVSYRLRLSLLQAIADMRDWTIIDPQNEIWPPIHIIPQGEIPKKYMGMPASQISDPELRRNYELAIYENQEKLRKLRRELDLEKMSKCLVRRIQLTMSNAAFSDTNKYTQYMLLMSNIVTNVKMREQIYSDRRFDSFKIKRGQNKIQLATNGVAIEIKKEMNVKSNLFNSTSNTQIRTSEDEVSRKQEKRSNNINGIICCMAFVGISCFAIRRLRRN